MEHVLATLFEVPSEAYQAFVELKAFPQNDDTRIAQAALVKNENGVITPVDAFDPLRQVDDDTITGTLIGSVLGILGGPLGMLFGANVGAWVGSTGSTDEALAQATLLETVAAKLNDGDVAIIALAQEKSEAPLDQFFGRFKSLVVRWDASTIQQQMEDALEVQADLQALAAAELKARRTKARSPSGRSSTSWRRSSSKRLRLPGLPGQPARQGLSHSPRCGWARRPCSFCGGLRLLATVYG